MSGGFNISHDDLTKDKKLNKRYHKYLWRIVKA